MQFCHVSAAPPSDCTTTTTTCSSYTSVKSNVDTLHVVIYSSSNVAEAFWNCPAVDIHYLHQHTAVCFNTGLILNPVSNQSDSQTIKTCSSWLCFLLHNEQFGFFVWCLEVELYLIFVLSYVLLLTCFWKDNYELINAECRCLMAGGLYGVCRATKPIIR